MKNKLLAILSLALLAGPVVAEQIQSTTGAFVTFRQCIEGATACDSVSETKLSSFGGLPGDSEAQASQEDPAYGAANGRAKLTDSNGNAQLSAGISSLPGTRNGSNVFFIQRYTNTSMRTETFNLDANLTFDQTVPDGNSVFPDDSPANSGANAELEIFTLNVDALEAGTTARDNNYLILDGPPPGVIYESLGEAASMGNNDGSGEGSKALAVNVLIPPGESVWLLGTLQAIGANGATVNASLDTKTTIEETNQ